MKENPAILLLLFITLGFSTSVNATSYTYELSNDQTWAGGGTSSTNAETVTVRSYVPGSNNTTYKTITLYTPTYTSEANALGDVVGSVYNIYGSGTTAFVDPYDAPKRTIIYPAVQILHTRLLAVNDDRLAIGSYNVLGGHAAGRGFIYDVIYDQYTELLAPNTTWTDLSDINNLGQIVGTSINDDGATRKGFTYNCTNGFETFNIPGSSWTVPKKIDDQGNIYGVVSGIADAAYFIARPDSISNNSTCSLVPRDDVADPIFFDNATSFELSGDFAAGIKIADFNGGGVNDLLIYHEVGKTILYIGEDGFDSKIRYYGDEFNALAQGINIDTEWDFNNDGLIDKVLNNGTDNLLYFAKADGSYFYVPQKLNTGNLKFGDLNADGLIDIVTFNGQFASITFQTAQAVVVDPVTDPVDNVEVPAVDVNAYEIEAEDTIQEIRVNSVLLSSGKILWFNAETIIKFNDASAFAIGQTLGFKAWQNPDGALIGIKVEVIQ